LARATWHGKRIPYESWRKIGDDISWFATFDFFF